MQKEAGLIAGAEKVEGADINMPLEKKQECFHTYQLEKIVLKKKGLFSEKELLASVVFCKLCGRVSGSSRITF